MSDETDSGRAQMRPVFTCVICGCTYLPPKTMHYPQLGTDASPLHCSTPQCRSACAALPRSLRTAMAAMAWDRARPWMEQEPSTLPERARRRTRGRTRPRSARSKLG
ncbi:hypothetical protein GCM10010507_60060 [Streptomyces cinnamoneus]|uniref:Uncharacterized protein n=1 Tax=Streptomyces cinnamoneus TaxID=53446 RepID=A0A918WR50_STRCJ|nr:hypothetical protein GCM10010507_60060 [Streptomyces cinnamoneus]